MPLPALATALFATTLLTSPSSPVRAQSCATPAEVATLGLATAGSAGLLELVVEGAPVVGYGFRLRVENGPPLARGLLVVGQAVHVPPGAREFEPFDLPGRRHPFVLDGAGASPALLFHHPVTPDLCGTTILSQAVVRDPAAVGGLSRSATVRTIFGFGKGRRFQSQPNSPIGRNAVDAVAVDLDGDQVPDLVSSTIHSSGTISALSVLLGTGDGTFHPEMEFPVGPYSLPYSIAAGDVDGDGLVDVVTGGWGGQLMLGRGDGTFQSARPLGTTSDAGVAIGDLNADGIADLVLTQQIRGYRLARLMGRGGGAFGPAEYSSTGYNPISVALGDLDGDGRLDAVTGNRETDGYKTPGSISVLRGMEDGAFEPHVTIPCGGPDPGPYNAVWEVQLHDLNSDGRLDVVALVYDARNGGIAVFLGQRDGVLAAPVFWAMGNSPSDLVVADFDRDFELDLASSNLDDTRRLDVRYGRGDGSFRGRVTLRGQHSAIAIVARDMNGDHMPDVTMVDWTRDLVRVLENAVLR